MLLNQLKKYTPRTDESYIPLKKSISIFKEIAGTVNSSVTEKEMFNQMRNIYLKVIHYPIGKYGKLIQPHRKFLKEGNATWVDNPNEPNKPVWVLLFNDILVFCFKQEEETLSYLSQVKLLNSKVELCDKENPNLFKITEEKDYTISVESNDWFTSIENTINSRKENEKIKLKSLQTCPPTPLRKEPVKPKNLKKKKKTVRKSYNNNGINKKKLKSKTEPVSQTKKTKKKIIKKRTKKSKKESND